MFKPRVLLVLSYLVVLIVFFGSFYHFFYLKATIGEGEVISTSIGNRVIALGEVKLKKVDSEETLHLSSEEENFKWNTAWEVVEGEVLQKGTTLSAFLNSVIITSLVLVIMVGLNLLLQLIGWVRAFFGLG